MKNKTTKLRETTMRVPCEARDKIKVLAQKNGLKIGPMLARGLTRAITEKPEFFLP